MNQYVVAIALGPVQVFISAARRSRDLWAGSWLLSEISKAAALSLHANQAKLIFPFTDSLDQDLKVNSEFSVVNNVQAVIEAESLEAAGQIAQQAADAARSRFREVAEEAFGRLPGLREQIWSRQVEDYVDVYCACVQIKGGQYIDAANKAKKVLAARKASRDFRPAGVSADESTLMIPKSSLDGARETVLPEEGPRSLRTLRKKLRLSDSEQLDTAGVTKRMGGDSEQFTAFSRIAAHPWLQAIKEGAPERLRELCDAYRPLVRLDLATGVKGNEGIYQAFPFDAQMVYPFRLEAAIRDAQNSPEDLEALQSLQRCLKEIWREFGYPCPYAVLMLADGDKMGMLLDSCKTMESQQEVSKALSGFADSVHTTVRQFAGHALYAGGDDVLAMVPLNSAYECADSLRQVFSKKLEPVAQKIGGIKATDYPTLSVGLAIAHIMEPLGNIRRYADQAEKHAKGDRVEKQEHKRNALGILLAIRSGAQTKLRIRWDDENSQKFFQDLIDQFAQKKIPSRVAYDTRDVHRRTEFAFEKVGLSPIQKSEFKRMLERARTRSGESLDKPVAEKLNQHAKEIGLPALADQLIIARWMAAKTLRDIGDEQ